MKKEEINIEIYDKREKITSTLLVEEISKHRFKLLENDFFNCRLNFGTEIETRLNNDGKHEVVRIVDDSDYVTRRFFLTSQFKESDYRLLGDEIVKHGGLWEVGFGSMAIINLPKEAELDLDEIFWIFDFNPPKI